MAQNRQLLNDHPSVQDLQLSHGGLNKNKSLRHQYMINAGPLGDAETRSALNAKRVAKDQNVTAVRNEDNIRAAKLLAQQQQLAARKQQAQRKVSPTKPAATDRLPALPPRAGSRNSNAGSSVASSKAAALEEKRLADAKQRYKETVKHINTVKGKALTGGKAPSLVSTVFSYEGDTDDGSCSMYSCSCCHVAKASTVSGCSTDYENMTSISQRTPNSYVSSSASTSLTKKSNYSGASKIKKLEAELVKEREDRQNTLKELEKIQARQQLLLSKLSDEERAALAQATGK